MEQPEPPSGQPRNSYRAGLVVVAIAAAMLLTAGLVVAAPFGGGDAEEAAPITTSTIRPTTTTTTQPPTTTTTQAPTTTEVIDAFGIGLGECINLPDEDLVDTLEGVACTQPHDAEVYSIFDMAHTAAPYPGEEAVIDAAFDGCLAAFQTFVGVAYEFSELDVYYLHPTEESWKDLDDREIVCLLTALDGSKLTGSMEGSRR